NARAGAQKVSSQSTDISRLVHVVGKLRVASIPRRSGLRQAIAAQQDARRLVAEGRQSASASGLHVDAAPQKTSLYGRRVRAVERMAARSEPGLALARLFHASRCADMGARSKCGIQKRAGSS